MGHQSNFQNLELPLRLLSSLQGLVCFLDQFLFFLLPFFFQFLFKKLYLALQLKPTFLMLGHKGF
jgi:hypothetical protein